MNEVKVVLGNAETKDYYEFEKILRRNGIQTKMSQSTSNGTELGLTFNDLIIILPLLTPIAVEIRKVIEAYLIYKKPQNSKISIILEKNNKKLEIHSENADLPCIEEFSSFFDEE